MISKKKVPKALGLMHNELDDPQDPGEGIWGDLADVPVVTHSPLRTVISEGGQKLRRPNLASDVLVLNKRTVILSDVKTKTKTQKPFASKTRISTKPKSKTMRRGKVMPDMKINYDNVLPQEARGLTLNNVVSIPEELLRKISHRTKSATQEFGDLLLNNTAPSILAYDAGSSYVKAVMADGLGIEMDVDRGVLEVVKEMARLDVVFFFLKRLALPQALKTKFMHTFTAELSRTSLELMQKTNKSTAMSESLRELEGVILKRSEHVAKSIPNAKQRGAVDGKTDAVQRGRRDKPLAGGF